MTTTIEFISEHIFAFGIFALPLLYILLRDIFLYFRNKSLAKEAEKELQAQEQRVQNLLRQLDDNRQALMNSFEKLNQSALDVMNDDDSTEKPSS